MEKIIFITKHKSDYSFIKKNDGAHCICNNILFIYSDSSVWPEIESNNNILFKFIRFKTGHRFNLSEEFNEKCPEDIKDFNITDFTFDGITKLFILHHCYSKKDDARKMNIELSNWFSPLKNSIQIQISPYSDGNSEEDFYSHKQIFSFDKTGTEKDIANTIAINVKKVPIITKILNIEAQFLSGKVTNLESCELKIDDTEDFKINGLDNKKHIEEVLKDGKILLEKSILNLPDEHFFNLYFLSIEFLKKNATSNYIKFSDEVKNSIDQPMSILFIGVLDLFSDTKNKTYREQIKSLVDPRYRFFDSSIWFRYIPITADIKNEISKHIEFLRKQQGLFDLPEAQEFRDFSIRQFNESYIKKLGEGVGHATHIAPYGFHSESKMAKWAIEEESMIKDFKWNILIVDDDFSTNEHEGKKQKLIDTILEPNRANIGEERSKTIRQALNKIGVHSIEQGSQNDPKAIETSVPADIKYDIILLDYYFRDNGNGQPEFGEEFLIKLLQPNKADTEKNYLNDNFLGPTGKFWIFPISVYSTSLVDKLRDNRITWYDDKWIISPGADPLNTPELFRYKIFSFMRRQLEEFSIQYRPTDDKGTPDPNKHKKLFSQLAFYLIKFMYNLKGKGKFEDNTIIADWEKNPHFEINNEIIKHVQKSMLSIFPNIVEQGVKFKRLCANKDSSGLAKTVIEKFFFNFEYYDWDHFQNLIYLVAYGNRSNLDQVWNELNYLESRFNNEIEGKEGSKVLKCFIAIIKSYLE